MGKAGCPGPEAGRGRGRRRGGPDTRGRLPEAGRRRGRSGMPGAGSGGASGGSRQSHRPSGAGRPVKGAPCGRVAARWPLRATLDRTPHPGMPKDWREPPEERVTGVRIPSRPHQSGPGRAPQQQRPHEIATGATPTGVRRPAVAGHKPPTLATWARKWPRLRPGRRPGTGRPRSLQRRRRQASADRLWPGEAAPTRHRAERVVASGARRLAASRTSRHVPAASGRVCGPARGDVGSPAVAEAVSPSAGPVRVPDSL
ncbi:hypothetical protein SUDANB120_02689 [Streptomyces sp. enrichment culture]